MINLKIDPEFQNQIPPLTDDEYKQLEENILKEGKLLSPLIVWGNTLVDGHNRYAILQKHPEIYFSTMPLRFESREEVLAWICKNQLGRRNLTPEQKLFLIGKQYEAEKSSHGEARKESHDENGRFHRGKGKYLWTFSFCSNAHSFGLLLTAYNVPVVMLSAHPLRAQIPAKQGTPCACG